MNTNIVLIVVGVLVLIVIITISILISNAKKTKLKKDIDDLNVRYNEIKTTPIAFKLNKAQTMAKRNEKTSTAVSKYYQQYEEVEKRISDIQDLMNNLDDSFSSKKYKDAREIIGEVNTEIETVETEIEHIDKFLEKFSEKENEQREYSSKLKEEYRIIRNAVNANSNSLSISLNAMENKLNTCEELFSISEEWIYANEYSEAQESLEKIEAILADLRNCGNHIPSLIKDIKGVLPVMLDEVKREYALTRQRGVFLNHLDVDGKIEEIENNINSDTKQLIEGNIEGIKQRVAGAKSTLNSLTDMFEKENRAFKEAKDTNASSYENIQELVKIENYVRVAYDKDSARYGLENLQDTLKKQRDSIEEYKARYKEIDEELSLNNKPASELLDAATSLQKLTENDKKELYSYKTVIDKSNDGEQRAISQLVKLQLVVAEVETKVAEYHLPSIASTYESDLKTSYEHIDNIKKLLKEIPINIDELNTNLDAAIDFVFKFYNNVNNVVGMAIMVENAIVFGNKYRSTYPEIDRSLSKAEFQFLNGEYTKALKTAITCMETLFPENADEKIMENA
ncbi:MAG: hypothetical protein KBT35_06065 [Firmicutes bacterium]|nr:hypothetical protein [Candidatus Colivicinus equi]